MDFVPHARHSAKPNPSAFLSPDSEVVRFLEIYLGASDVDSNATTVSKILLQFIFVQEGIVFRSYLVFQQVHKKHLHRKSSLKEDK